MYGNMNIQIYLKWYRVFLEGITDINEEYISGRPSLIFEDLPTKREDAIRENMYIALR